MKEEDKLKLAEAEEKKKKDAEESKNDAKASIRMGQEPVAAKGAKGGAKGKAGPRSDMEEVLYELVDDLRAELSQRDQEYEHMRQKCLELEQSNKAIAKQLMTEQWSKQTIEAKLNKLKIHRELDENQARIS